MANSSPPSRATTSVSLTQRPVGDLDRTSVRGPRDRDFSQRHVAQDIGAILLDVALERSGLLSMRDDVAKGAARLYHVRRQAVHLNVALVADHDPVRRIKQ